MARQIYRRRTRSLANPNQNLTGRAVGAIGKTLGDTFDETKDALDKKKAADKAAADKKAADDKANLQQIEDDAYAWKEDQDLQDLEDDTLIAEVDAEILGEEFDPLEGIPDVVPDEVPEDGGDGSNITDVVKGGSGGIDVTESNDGNPYPEIKPFYGPDMPNKATAGSNPNNDGGGQGGFDLAPLGNAISEGFGNLWDKGVNWLAGQSSTQRVKGESAYKRKSPFDRHSPFHAAGYDPNTGTPIGEGYIQRAKPLSYLGDIGVAAAEGYNAAIDRHNYKRAVWDTKQKELDQQFGSLVVPPSGVAPLDASVETMAREWKTELAQLQNAKGSMDPGEYAAAKHEIMGRSKTYKAASQQIQQLLTDYANDKDNISASTKPEILDLIETLSQGGNVKIGNDPATGQPTLGGTTIGGKPISVPLAQIANGKNAFRYNKKVDIAPQMAQITKTLGSLKRDVEQANGSVLRGPQAWAAVEQSASAQVDNLLNNEAAVRAIAAEQFNIDYDEWEKRGSETAKDDVKDLLMQRLEQQYSAAAGNQQIIKQAPKPPAAQQRTSQLEGFFTNALTGNDFSQLNGRLAQKGLEIERDEDGTLLLWKGDELVSEGDAIKGYLVQQYGGRIENASI